VFTSPSTKVNELLASWLTPSPRFVLATAARDNARMSDRTAAVAQCVPAGGSYADCGHRTTARVVKRPQPGTHWGPQAGFRPTNAVPWQHQPLTYVTFGVMSDFTTIGSHVAHLASKQAGVVSGQQVLERGMSRRQIDRQLASQTCLTLLSGIYVLGGVPITWTTWAWAGVLATGPGACLVGASAHHQQASHRGRCRALAAAR